MIRVSDMTEAWRMARAITGETFSYYKYGSENAGYGVYNSDNEDSLTYVCDLGCRLEVNKDGDSINIWIEEINRGQTKEDLIEEAQKYIDRALIVYHVKAYKQFFKYYSIADHNIDLLIERYGYDFIEENRTYRHKYNDCVCAFTSIKIKDSI